MTTNTTESRPYLSKSLYIKGLQCHKALWLHKYRPDLKDEVSDSQQAVFDSGTNIGIFAQQLFPGGTKVPYDRLSATEQVELARRLIEDEVGTIYEAAFSFDNTFCKVDILHQAEDGWKLYEVKGSTRCKDVYLDDIALQYHVLTGAGIRPVRTYLVHLNNGYVRRGNLDVHGLFTLLDVTDEVEQKQDEVREQLAAQRGMLAGDLPDTGIGPHCESPYSCAFSGHCWAHVPEDSVFSIRGHGKPNCWQLYAEGILRFQDVPEERLGWRQKLQQRGLRETFLHVDREPVVDFLGNLDYPLTFMDFETLYMVSVPIWDGTRPYQQIPFQFSLHVVDDPGTESRHFEFLADGDSDPRPEFLRSLLAALPQKGSIVTWNASFEADRLRDLATIFPSSARHIDSILHRIADLMIPFRKKDIYHSGFDGSYSIKYVLPALVPELSYDSLPISNGEMASDAWLWLLHCDTPSEKARVRQELLDYCRLDTLAMVRILGKMEELVSDVP